MADNEFKVLPIARAVMSTSRLYGLLRTGVKAKSGHHPVPNYGMAPEWPKVTQTRDVSDSLGNIVPFSAAAAT